MPSPLNNDMGSVTQHRDPTTPPNWHMLFSGYAPLALYAAVYVVGRAFARRINRRAVVTG